MTKEETQLVVSLARDPSYPTPESDKPQAIRQWLLTASKMDEGSSDYDNEAVHDRDCVYLFVEDFVVFLREYCLYDDLSPNHGPLNQWLRLLRSEVIQLAEITPESWNKLLTSKVIQKMQT